jgi:hypothetical protein
MPFEISGENSLYTVRKSCLEVIGPRLSRAAAKFAWVWTRISGANVLADQLTEKNWL